MNNGISHITDCLAGRAADPFQRYIFVKDILRLDPSSVEYQNALGATQTSAWRSELADDQHADGSWGMFHGGDTAAQRRQRFPCTEAALRRARELGLTRDDPIIARCIALMERYALREAPYPDYIEKHGDDGRGHYFSIPFGVAANINVFDPDNRVVKPLRDMVADVVREAFAGGYDADVFPRAVAGYRVPSTMVPGNAFALMLLCNADCMDDAVQRMYLNHVWNKRCGIMYMSNYPITKKRDVSLDCRHVEGLKTRAEDKNFYAWLSLIELFKDFSLFRELMKPNLYEHLHNEAERLINGGVELPKPPAGHVNACYHMVGGRYAEGWRDGSKRVTDLALRIARLLVLC